MKYLLLRDNKQSGPYTFDELKAKGLKAYDLVWVEGRSAAWRYPSEVDELTAFAPAVEEQPFDRFFKKPAAAGSSATSAAVVSLPPASNTTTIKRAIYVTMPGGVAKEVVREIPVRESVRSAARDNGANEMTPTRERTDLRDRSAAAEPEGGRDRGDFVDRTDSHDRADSRDRSEYGVGRRDYRREPAAEILPPLSKRKTNRVGQLALVAFAVAVVLAAGIFIGLSIQKDSYRFDKLAARTPTDNLQPVRSAVQQVAVRKSANDSTTSGAPGGPTNNQATNPMANPPSNSANPMNPSNLGATSNTAAAAVTASQGLTKPRHSNRPKTQAAKITASVPATTDSSLTPPLLMRREAVHRTDAAQTQATDNKENLRATLANEVSVGTNKFEVGTFGGIRNLQVTVTNRSAYALDLVVVQVSYIQANKKTYKSENLYFRSIGPGSALMLDAPKTSRGINIQYKITSIDSKELGLSQPGT